MDSLAETLDRLTAAGYGADFYARGGMIGCPECDELVDPATLVVDSIVRLEGDSDPDEEIIVYALSGGPCDRKGTFTIAFGSAVTPDDEAVASVLRDRPHRREPM